VIDDRARERSLKLGGTRMGSNQREAQRGLRVWCASLAGRSLRLYFNRGYSRRLGLTLFQERTSGIRRWSFALLYFAGVVISLAAASLLFAANEKQLSPRYKKWLDEEVPYIITRDEKNAFLQLKADADRDVFIKQFWEVRNPDPGSPINTYEEEHYRRIAYANDHFGKESGNRGWRTAMGRIYIVLGPPKQTATYHDTQEMRPVEIWFYSNSHQALPPFFYVLFYREDNFSEYKTYSPYFDGPEKLITKRGLSRVQAWRELDKSQGREVATRALSLIEGEPVDSKNAVSTLQSDVMLSILHDLANNPLTLRELSTRRAIANVTSALILEGDTLGALAVPVRDAAGNSRVDYVLRFSKPEDLTLEQTANDRAYLEIGARVQVYGPDHRLLFTQERSPTEYLTKSQVEQIKDRVFGVEGSLPLPPGKYHLEFALTNWLKHASYRGRQDIVVPEAPSKGLAVTNLVPFSTATDASGTGSTDQPFTFGGVKFTPLLKREMNLSQGEKLKVFYQIWAPPSDVSAQPDLKLKASYVYGRPGALQDAQNVEDDVAKAQFDPHGSLVNGKQLPTEDLPPGNYQMTLTLTDPASRQQAFSTVNFRLLLLPSAPAARPWDIFPAAPAETDFKTGVYDYERAVCYQAFGEHAQASEWFRRALEKNAASQEALAGLVESEFAQEDYSAVAKLATQVTISGQTGESTVLHLAEALDKTGETQKAIDFLESTLKTRTPSGPTYFALAEYYQKAGNADKAREATRKGKQLMLSGASNP